jgi:hypothetical protein
MLTLYVLDCTQQLLASERSGSGSYENGCTRFRQGNPAYKKLWYCSKQIEMHAYYTKYTQENANRIIVSCNIYIATEWIIEGLL